MSFLHSPSQILNPLAHQRMFGYGTGSGKMIHPLPAGATARWDASTLSGSDGDLIATFADSIGSNDATAAGSARATLKTGVNGLNGMNVLRFDGVANAYTLTSDINTSGDFTILAVMKRIGTNAVALGQNGDFLPALGRDATTVLIGNGRGSESGGYAQASNALTGWEIVSAAWSGTAAVRGQSNNSLLSFGATAIYGNSTNWNRIGRRGSVYGSQDLAELVYWPSVLTATDIANAHLYFNAKWGVY